MELSIKDAQGAIEAITKESRKTSSLAPFLYTHTLYVCQQTTLKEYEESDRAARINSKVEIAKAKLEELRAHLPSSRNFQHQPECITLSIPPPTAKRPTKRNKVNTAAYCKNGSKPSRWLRAALRPPRSFFRNGGRKNRR